MQTIKKPKPMVEPMEKATDLNILPPSRGLIGSKLNKLIIAIHAEAAANIGLFVKRYTQPVRIASANPQRGPIIAITTSALRDGNSLSPTAAPPTKGMKEMPFVFTS